MMSLDRTNVLVVSVVILLATAIVIPLLVFANVQITRSDNGRAEAHYRACLSLPVPAQSGCLGR